VFLPLIYLMQPHGQPISLAALDLEEKIIAGELSLQTARSQNELRDWQIVLSRLWEQRKVSRKTLSRFFSMREI
jgi:hypothetical protein